MLRCLPFVLLAMVQGVPVHHYDVAVIGGGGAGANTAEFIKRNGYKVVVVEKTGLLGGHCNTVNKSGVMVDLGVVAYMNTTYINSIGFGNFTLDMEAHVRK